MPDLLIPIDLNNPGYAQMLNDLLAEFAGRTRAEHRRDGPAKCAAFISATLDMGSLPGDPWKTAKLALDEMLNTTMDDVTQMALTGELGHGMWEQIKATIRRWYFGELEIIVDRNSRLVGVRCTNLGLYESVSMLGAVFHNMPHQTPRYVDEPLYLQMQELCAQVLKLSEYGGGHR